MDGGMKTEKGRRSRSGMKEKGWNLKHRMTKWRNAAPPLAPLLTTSRMETRKNEKSSSQITVDEVLWRNHSDGGKIVSEFIVRKRHLPAHERRRVEFLDDMADGKRFNDNRTLHLTPQYRCLDNNHNKIPMR